MALTYDKLIRLAQALNMDLKDIVAAEQPRPADRGRKAKRHSCGRGDGKPRIGTPRSPLSGGRTARQNDDPDHHRRQSTKRRRTWRPLVRHSRAKNISMWWGGAMELHSDLYAPLRLGPGDSGIFRQRDGAWLKHVRISAERCTVLSVCAGVGIQQLAGAAGKSWRLTDDHSHSHDQ